MLYTTLCAKKQALTAIIISLSNYALKSNAGFAANLLTSTADELSSGTNIDDLERP